jgi:hypothetical protein
MPFAKTAPSTTSKFPDFETKIQSMWREVLALERKSLFSDAGDSTNNNGVTTTISNKNSNIELSPSTPFFSLPGADLTGACTLAARFKQEGYDISAEEVIDIETLGR